MPLHLGVNIDHVVTLRQARYREMLDSPNAEPSVLQAALESEAAGAHSITEFDDSDKAVAAGAVLTLRARIASRPERGERPPLGGGEGDGDARLCIVELLDDCGIVPLKPVDFPPRRFPAAEISGQPVGCCHQRGEFAGRGGGEQVIITPHAGRLQILIIGSRAPQRFPPEHRQL